MMQFCCYPVFKKDNTLPETKNQWSKRVKIFRCHQNIFFLDLIYLVYTNHLLPINALLSVFISYFIKTFNALQKLMSLANLF